MEEELQKPKEEKIQSPPWPSTAAPMAPLTPTMQQTFYPSGYSFAAIAPAVPPSVWTPDNFATVVAAIKEAGQRDHDYNTQALKQQWWLNRAGLKLVWLFSIVAVLLLAFACILLREGNPIGTNLILGILAFVSGALAGWGAKSARR